MQKYQKHFPITQTPQSQPIPGTDQVANNAGGFGWQLSDWEQLDRFLILGAEDGTYYVDEKELTIANAQSVLRCIKADGKRVVATVVAVSVAGRAPKNDPALFVLAMCAACGDVETKQAALDSLSAVARIGTHLFHFVAYVRSMRGWGRSLRNAVKLWYMRKTPEGLAYEVTKYQSRDGWSHRDLLRLSHPKPHDFERAMIYKYIVKGELIPAEGNLPGLGSLTYLQAVEEVKHAQNAEQVAALIAKHRLPREVVPTERLADPIVWEALLDVGMPLTAMIRNLGNMSKCGLLSPMNPKVRVVCEKLMDKDAIHKARIHPIAILLAMGTYGQGRGFLGHGSWLVSPQIMEALNWAFYASFEKLEPTGKRICIAIDGSGSMQSSLIAGTNISCAQAAAALAMAAVHVETNYVVCSFTTRLRQHIFSTSTRIDDAMHTLHIANEGTDGALPMMWARHHNIPVDAFMLITDNETWAGNIHPAQALEMYRHDTGMKAKMIAVGMTANDVSVADPGDPNSLNVVGFDSSVPQVMADFIRG